MLRDKLKALRNDEGQKLAGLKVSDGISALGYSQWGLREQGLAEVLLNLAVIYRENIKMCDVKSIREIWLQLSERRVPPGCFESSACKTT